MTHPEELISQLLGASTADAQRLAAARRLIAEYPFFTLPAIVALRDCRSLLTEREQEEMTLKVALSDSGHTELFNILSSRAGEFRNFYPPEQQPATPTTEDAIDTFLRRYGSGADNPQETALLERLIFNPMPEYASVLRQQDTSDPAVTAPAPANSHAALIDEFIRKHNPDAAAEQPAPAEPARQPHIADPSPDSLLSETLAKFHIRRRQYDKALEIISNLAVSYPHKSEQYESQMRFLRKLIKNQKLSQPS